MRKLFLTLSLSTLCVVGFAGPNGGVPAPAPAVSHGCSGPSGGHSGPSHGCGYHGPQVSGPRCSDVPSYNRSYSYSGSYSTSSSSFSNTYWHVRPNVNYVVNDSMLNKVYAYMGKADKLLEASDSIGAAENYITAYFCFDKVEPAVKAHNYGLKHALAMRIIALPSAPHFKLTQGEILETAIKDNQLSYVSAMKEAYESISKAEKSLLKSRSEKAAMAYAEASQQLDAAIKFNKDLLSYCTRLNQLNINKDAQSQLIECNENVSMLSSLKEYLNNRLSRLTDKKS